MQARGSRFKLTPDMRLAYTFDDREKRDRMAAARARLQQLKGLIAADLTAAARLRESADPSALWALLPIREIGYVRRPENSGVRLTLRLAEALLRCVRSDLTRREFRGFAPLSSRPRRL